MDRRALASLGSWSGWAGDRRRWPVSSDGVLAVEWAVDVHRAHFGDEVLRRALDESGPHPFVRGCWPLSNVYAIVSLLNRACALSVLDASAGHVQSARFGKGGNREIISDLHVLGIAGLAVRDGWRVHVEAALPSGRRPDLRATRKGSELWVEVTSMGHDRIRQQLESWTDTLWAELQYASSRWGVEIDADVGGAGPPAEQREPFLGRIEAVAQRVNSTGVSETLNERGVAVTVRPFGTGSGRFHGPLILGDMWPRIEQRLIDKAQQTEGASSAWIYVEDNSDIFELTDLAAVDDSEKLRRLANNVTHALDDYRHVSGVLLSTGVRMDVSAVDVDIPPLRGPTDGLNRRCRVLRRRLPGGRSRRTFVVRMADDLPRRAAAPERWFEREGSWLDWALAAVGQRRLDLILSDPRC